MLIKLMAEGGGMKPGPALSQKLGPAGINIGQVISKVNDSTKQFTGMKVPVEIDINTATKEIRVIVLSPPTAALLKNLVLKQQQATIKKQKSQTLLLNKLSALQKQNTITCLQKI